MPIPCPDEVREILCDFHDRIRAVVDGAWEEWLTLPYRGRFVFPARARAVIVFDFIARRAQEEFDGDPNIKVLVKKQTVQFLFRDRVLTRFKKGNGKGIGSNIITQAVLDFVDPQRNIPGLVPDILKVEFCYTIGDMGFDLENLEVVARNENRRLWAYPLDRGAAGAEVIVVPSPPAPDDRPPVVTPKKPKTDSGENEQ